MWLDSFVAGICVDTVLNCTVLFEGEFPKVCEITIRLSSRYVRIDFVTYPVAVPEPISICFVLQSVERTCTKPRALFRLHE
jgi:hypothetical protein